MKEVCPRPVSRHVKLARQFHLQQFLLLPIAMLAWCPLATQAATEARDYAVLVSVSLQSSPAQITLNWPQDTFGVPANYIISRKAPEETVWIPLATLSGTETNFVDGNVSASIEYEYQVQKIATGYVGYGYILAGMETPLTEYRGKVLLIVDNTLASDLTPELARLQQDLVGDGWQVVRHDVDRNDSPANIKALIMADYAADPANVRSVFLFGHAPVPYSGDIVPDGHSPNHRGAWPADVYYADVNSVWSDGSTTSTNATDPRNLNVPGDGKFDPSSVTALAELEVGRVDLANLPSFALPERELLRQYLNKDHNFRHKLVTAQPRGLICDSFGVSAGSAFAATGWRNFAAFFGASNVVASSTWFSALTNDSYLWAYGCGGGSFTSVAGIGTTADFAANDPQAVFTFLFGSYFGDWDTTDNVMRAALATPTYTLTSAWAGRPHWFVHHMALGETIGHSTRLSQNNTVTSPYRQINAGSQQIHVALMGDPTLRLHSVAPPSGATATGDAGFVVLAWNPSVDPVLGYFIYRASDEAGPYVRVNDSLVIENSFIDEGLATGHYTYLIRAVKLETSASGSYYNASQGAFATATITAPALSITPAADQTVEIGTGWIFPPPVISGGSGSVTLTPVSTATNFTCGNCFSATRVWQATDAAGHAAQCSQTVTVTDTTVPTLVVPADKTVTSGTAWTFDLPTVTDAGGSVITTVLSTETNGSTATRMWSATDPCGNVNTGSQTVTVHDVPTLPTVIIVATDASASEAGNTGTYLISRTGSIATTLTVSLSYSGSAENGVDHAKLATQITIPAGSSSVAIVLKPLPDAIREKTESAIATLQPSKTYVIGSSAKAAIFIANAGAKTMTQVIRPTPAWLESKPQQAQSTSLFLMP